MVNICLDIKPDFTRMRKLLISFLIFLASLVGINDAAIAAVGQNGATPGNFDYYVLSLSWLLNIVIVIAMTHKNEWTRRKFCSTWIMASVCSGRLS